MRTVSILLLLAACVLTFACGKSAPEDAETVRRAEARALAGSDEMQAFLKKAQSELAEKIGPSAVTDSPVKVARAIKGGADAGTYVGQPVAWTGTVVDYNPGGILLLRCPDGLDIVTVGVVMQASAGANLKDINNALGVVVGGTIQTADAEHLSLVNGFVSAMWLSPFKGTPGGKSYDDIIGACVGNLSEQ